MASDRDTANPNACAVCDVDREKHLTRYAPDRSGKPGWHQWVAPTDEQRKARLIARRTPPGDRDALAGLIAGQGYDLDRGPRVPEWPEDEREYHRSSDWLSFEHRANAMQEYRRGKLADVILAAGVRPPARVITDPAELEALPMDSIVVDHHDAGWQMADRDYDDTAVWEYRSAAKSSAELLAGGARVRLVHVPGEEDRRGEAIGEPNVEQLRRLLADLTDPDDCDFDHHGGCQAHGYLTLKPGELCPHAEAKQLLAEGGE